MTADEIKAKIGFSLFPGETEESRLIVGTLIIACQSHVTRECFMRPELLQCIKNEIAEGILKRIYADQRSEMAYAVSKFLQSHYTALPAVAMQDQERLMKAARYQPRDRFYDHDRN